MRGKMGNSQRAKQFMPFAALKGFEEAIDARNIEYEEKRLLTEESSELLDRKLRHLCCGDRITAEYFDRGRYRIIEGILQRKDLNRRIIRIDRTEIRMDDLYDISGDILPYL